MITSLEPSVADTGRYSIKEACQILGICRTTLRKHTDAGFIKCGHRRPIARKFYTGFEIKRYWKSTMN